MPKIGPYDAETRATAALSLIEGLVQMLLEKGTLTQDEAGRIYISRADAWTASNAEPSPDAQINDNVAALLRMLAGGRA